VVSTNSYIYFTNGLGAAGAVGILERGAIGADGSLVAPLTAKSYNNASQAGYGALTAVNFLFELGGYETSNNMLLDKMTSVQIGNAAGDLPSSFTPQGGGQIQTTGGTAVPLAFPGATAGGAYFWLAGGATPNLTTATKQTFWVLY
jgi:hypothetical protein